MKRPCHLIMLVSLGLVLSAGNQPACAQLPYSQPGVSPYNRPTVSPYLNLLNRGNPAVNYYGLVRPQQAYNTALYSLEQQVTASRVAATAAESQAAPSTGHPIYFLHGYQRFYLNTGAVAPFQNLQATVGAGAGGASASGAGSRATSNIISGASTPNFRR